MAWDNDCLGCSHDATQMTGIYCKTKNLLVSRHPRSFLEKTPGWTDGSAI